LRLWIEFPDRRRIGPRQGLLLAGDIAKQERPQVGGVFTRHRRSDTTSLKFRSREMANWIVVGSPENFEIARERGFDMFGFQSSRRRESAEMKAGDKLIFYLTGVMKFGGVAEVKSEVFEDRTPVFRSEKKAAEDYPF